MLEGVKVMALYRSFNITKWICPGRLASFPVLDEEYTDTTIVCRKRPE